MSLHLIGARSFYMHIFTHKSYASNIPRDFHATTKNSKKYDDNQATLAILPHTHIQTQTTTTTTTLQTRQQQRTRHEGDFLLLSAAEATATATAATAPLPLQVPLVRGRTKTAFLRTARLVGRWFVADAAVHHDPVRIVGGFLAGGLVQDGLGQLPEGLLDVHVRLG